MTQGELVRALEDVPVQVSNEGHDYGVFVEVEDEMYRAVRSVKVDHYRKIVLISFLELDPKKMREGELAQRIGE